MTVQELKAILENEHPDSEVMIDFEGIDFPISRTEIGVSEAELCDPGEDEDDENFPPVVRLVANPR
jgi:hypothetical protein